MAELPPVRLALAKILARESMTVADLFRRINENGAVLDRKTLYRMASGEPVRNLNLPIAAAISRALQLRDPGELIDWSLTSSPPVRLQRIDARTQARLDELMTKNTEGSLKPTERRELEKLGRIVEKLSLENARFLSSHTPARALRRKTASQP